MLVLAVLTAERAAMETHTWRRTWMTALNADLQATLRRVRRASKAQVAAAVFTKLILGEPEAA